MANLPCTTHGSGQISCANEDAINAGDFNNLLNGVQRLQGFHLDQKRNLRPGNFVIALDRGKPGCAGQSTLLHK